MAAPETQRAAEATGRLVDELTVTFAQELEQVLRLLRGRIRSLVRTLTTSDGRLVATAQNLASVVAMRRRIQDALRQAGFEAFADAATDAPLQRIVDSVLRGQPEADAAARLTNIEPALRAMRRVRFAEVLQIGEDVAIRVWRTMLDAVVGSRPLVDLVDDIADTLEISARQARSIYDTALSVVSRQASQFGTTGEPEELFFYVGPVDNRVRPFCREHVGKVYTREAIDAMDNGQLPNVMLTGGGYNCRHIFQRVSAIDRELIDLAGTGRRHQAVEGRMRSSGIGVAA